MMDTGNFSFNNFVPAHPDPLQRNLPEAGESKSAAKAESGKAFSDIFDTAMPRLDNRAAGETETELTPSHTALIVESSLDGHGNVQAEPANEQDIYTMLAITGLKDNFSLQPNPVNSPRLPEFAEYSISDLSTLRSLVTGPLTDFADNPLQNSPYHTLRTTSLLNQSSGNDLPHNGKQMSEGLFFFNEKDSDPFTRLTSAFAELALSKGQPLESGLNTASLQPVQPSPQLNLPLSALTMPNPALQAGSLPASTMAGDSTLAETAGNTNNTVFSIESPVGSDSWNQQVESKIRWMTRLNISTAELKLHPAELGSVEIRISAEDDQARISFVAMNNSTRELIESSLPRLRDLLNDSGMQLEQSDVSGGNNENRDAAVDSDQQLTDHVFSESESQTGQTAASKPLMINSLVDHYV